MFAWVIPIVTLLLGALKSHAVAVAPQGTPPGSTLAGWILGLEDLLTGANGLTAPTSLSAGLADLGVLVADVAKNGPAVGLPAEVVNGAALASSLFGTYAAVESDYLSNQTAVLDAAFSWQGKAGTVLALSKALQAATIPPGSVTIADALGLT